MNEYCVMVADAVRARFFSLEPGGTPEFEAGPRLVEGKGMVNPEREAPGREIFGNTNGGRTKATAGKGHSCAFDDHRANHRLEFERRFARGVAAEFERQARAEGATRLVVAASTRMLGTLEKELQPLARSGMDVRTIARDMTKLTAPEIQETLAKDDLVPACRRPSPRRA